MILLSVVIKTLRKPAVLIPRIFFLLAFFSLFLSFCAGLLLSIYYTSYGYFIFKLFGITFRELRPIHTIFAFSWIFLGSIGIIYYYLFSIDFVKRQFFYVICYIHFFLWFFAGIFILCSLYVGNISGREYFDYHPVISIFFLENFPL